MEDERAAPGERPDLERLDFAGLTERDTNEVRNAIARGENFHGYIPAESLGFIIRNYRILAPMGALEAAWLDAYVHSSHFCEHGLSVVKSIFDACNWERLCMLKPFCQALTFEKEGRFTLFRGCAGQAHSMCMSWTRSLDKAVWYAAHHVEYYDLANPAVYVATMPMAEIYCRADGTLQTVIEHGAGRFKCYNRPNDADSWRNHKNIFEMIFPLESKV
jgi:hypothetical protein